MVLSLEFSQTLPHIYLHWTPQRESLDSWRILQEISAFKSTLNQSITDDLAYKKQKKSHSMNHIERKLDFLDRNYWSVVKQQETLICSIIKSPYPKINLSLIIESDFTVNVFCRHVEIGNYKIPKHVTDQNTLEILIENTKKMDTEQLQIKP